MRRHLPLFFLFLLGMIPLLDLFHPGLPITHDGQDHVARIANFYRNLTEGNIIPRWAGNLNWGFGHPILMFLYPLPSYFASLFHLLGFSLVDSIKIVFGVSFLLSGVFMFLWLRNFLPAWSGFIGGILYMFAPYRFVDLYVRGAIGEHVAFMFLPLVLYFLLKISKGKYSSFLIIGGSFSLAALILSHNAISIMFLPIIFLYSLFLIFTNKNKTLVYYYTSILVLGLGLSAFFWGPAFFEGKYTLRDIVTTKDYLSRFVEFGRFFYGNWNYGISGQFSVQIGILHLVAVLLSIPFTTFLFKKSREAGSRSAGKNKLWIMSSSLLVMFLASLFIMHQSSRFIWENISTLQKFQFPWRFLSITVFVTSVLGAIVVSQFHKKYIALVVISLVVLTLFFNKEYWKARDFLLKPEAVFTGIYDSTTDTGESSPIWSVRFMEKRPKAHLEVIDGDAQIKELKRTSTYHKYQVKVGKNTLFGENTLYFPGWEIKTNEKSLDVEFQNMQYRGIMVFNLPKGDHIIEAKFKETKLRLFSNLTSFLSIILLIGLLGINKLKIREILKIR